VVYLFIARLGLFPVAESTFSLFLS